MGKYRSKLKRQTKGKRWPKGQSASSNPDTKTFRELARSNFFQLDTAPSQLTSDAVSRHDALVSSPPKFSQEAVEPDDDDMESTGTSEDTIGTFASNWSACSNVTFRRLLRRYRPESEMQKEMLTILAAVTDLIKSNGGSESTTEYFAVLMTTLDVTKSKGPIGATLALLNMTMKSVPKSILRRQFSETSKQMLDILGNADYPDGNMKSVIGCLASLLRAQELAAWNESSTLQIFASILAFTTHNKHKIRKSAQSAVCSVLKGSCFMVDKTGTIPTNHPAAGYVAEFFIQHLNDLASTQMQTPILHSFTLLRQIVHLFPKPQMKKACEVILKVMTVHNTLIKTCGFQVFHSLFSPQTATMSALLNGQLISALYEYQPASADTQLTRAWLAVMQEAHIHLADIDILIACQTLPKVISTLTHLWLSERPEVMNSTTHTLQAILEDCVGPACATSNIAHQQTDILQKCFVTIESCLGYQYNKAWNQVLYVVSIMFKVAGKHCSSLLKNCLRQLAELRDSYKFPYNNALEHAVGVAIKFMGPDVVLNIIRLQEDESTFSIDRSWLLPVLKENVQYATLQYFIEKIIPLASICKHVSIQLSASNDGIGSHSYHLLYLQLWSLLASFCKNPTDVKDYFKKIAKTLGDIIANEKELRLIVMCSIRRLITDAVENENEEEIKELAHFARNFLPLLINLYTTKPNGTDEEGHRLAAFDTIKVYLTISHKHLPKDLFMVALRRLKSNEKTSDSFLNESLLDIIRALVPYQDIASVSTLYDDFIAHLSTVENYKEQKKVYRLLEEICNSESEGCKEFITKHRAGIQKLLMKSLPNVAISSKGARLRCYICLIKAQPQLDHESKLLRSVIPEAIMCCQDINVKCRASAYNLLNAVGETLEKHSQLSEFTSMLISGLGGTTHMISSTILALGSVLQKFIDTLGPANIAHMFDMVSELFASGSREVLGSCLTFIKTYITTLPMPLLTEFVPRIMDSLSYMTEDCKRHYRLRVRDILDRLIQKYGCDYIANQVPESNVIMHKRLKNLRKLNTRKKKQKIAQKKEEEQNGSNDEDFVMKSKPKSMEDILADSDSDLDMEVDEPQPNRRKMSTWIQEESDSIVDFTDSATVRNITTTKPGIEPTVAAGPQKNKNRDFKTAPDGRLIISDNLASDSDEFPRKKHVIKLDTDTESEDDNKSAAETAILGNNKRKRFDTETVASGVSSQPANKYKAGGSGIHRPIKSSAKSACSDAGSEYKAPKAKGDVKKKGKVEPYAYLSLTRSSLNKRKQLKNAGQFKKIVGAATKGAKKGAKAGKKNKKR